MSNKVDQRETARSPSSVRSSNTPDGDPTGRVEEFIQLFNRVENFLKEFIRPLKENRFKQLVEVASAKSAAVQRNSHALKQFAMLRNAIVHDAGYPRNIVAVPSSEALSKFSQIAQNLLEPVPLIPTFASDVRCFSPSESLSTALEFMRESDFSQTVVRAGNGMLSLLTVEGIAWWLADNLKGSPLPADTVTLDEVIALEPKASFRIMGPDKTIFDANDAFRNSIHCEATRLYAIVITRHGGDRDEPIGVVTPWDLVHNPQLQQ